jgi:hypothetical protein
VRVQMPKLAASNPELDPTKTVFTNSDARPTPDLSAHHFDLC